MNEFSCPQFQFFINPTFQALQLLGGSGTNEEIYEKVIEIMKLSDEVLEFPHLNSSSQSEVRYRMAWARTYLNKAKVITNSARSVWSINPEYTNVRSVDTETIVKEVRKLSTKSISEQNVNDNNLENDGVELPDEIKPWRKKLYDVLINMDPYAFERLTKRLLRECGFVQVEVTKKSNDGGIDGTGKLKINGIFSFNIAFQCKRYQGTVGSGDIRDFRGSLTTDIEKGVFITTGSFSKAAREEASDPGKQQIDLIDGEEFIDKLAEFGVGIREIKDYVIDEEYFSKI